MPLKGCKKGGPWLIPWFEEDPDIRVYTASIIKELKALNKRYENEAIGMPINIIKDIVAVFLYLAH